MRYIECARESEFFPAVKKYIFMSKKVFIKAPCRVQLWTEVNPSVKFMKFLQIVYIFLLNLFETSHYGADFDHL